MLSAAPALQDDALLESYASKALHMDVHAPLGSPGRPSSTGPTRGVAAWVGGGSGEGLFLTGSQATDADIRCVDVLVC